MKFDMNDAHIIVKILRRNFRELRADKLLRIAFLILTELEKNKDKKGD